MIDRINVLIDKVGSKQRLANKIGCSATSITLWSKGQNVGKKWLSKFILLEQALEITQFDPNSYIPKMQELLIKIPIDKRSDFLEVMEIICKLLTKE